MIRAQIEALRSSSCSACLRHALRVRQCVSVPAGEGRLLAEIPDTDTGMNITFTTAEAIGQHPQFHITPEFGWMNDPNGMFQLGALYHVFFQYNPVAGTEQKYRTVQVQNSTIQSSLRLAMHAQCCSLSASFQQTLNIAGCNLWMQDALHMQDSDVARFQSHVVCLKLSRQHPSVIIWYHHILLTGSICLLL